MISLVVKTVGVAVNVFSINGEHLLLNRSFSCRGAYDLPRFFVSVRLDETALTAQAAGDTAAIDLRLKAASSLRVSPTD